MSAIIDGLEILCSGLELDELEALQQMVSDEIKNRTKRRVEDASKGISRTDTKL